ncbi:LysE family transporter [Burkholderia stagnalis]|uniref:LysE family transporter n=1 Tax=Burkholderia stagnalis TaxID=1503054 RepID=UPI000A9C47B6|nr:LysE family transporter [Burkholderia stagnalis]
MSLLNPYAWIDTVLLLGTVIASHAPHARAPFTAGAMAASLAWFVMQAYGGACVPRVVLAHARVARARPVRRGDDDRLRDSLRDRRAMKSVASLQSPSS